MSASPRWMTAGAVVCLVTLVAIVSGDLFVPAARNTEVWFGFEVTGWPAILTAPVHWAIFAVGAWAFWTGRRRALTWAAAYLFYVALSHLVWSEASPHGRGWPIGLLQAAVFSTVAVLILRQRARVE